MVSFVVLIYNSSVSSWITEKSLLAVQLASHQMTSTLASGTCWRRDLDCCQPRSQHQSTKFQLSNHMDAQEKIICLAAFWYLSAHSDATMVSLSTFRRYVILCYGQIVLPNVMLLFGSQLLLSCCSTHGLDCYGNLYFLGYQEYRAASLGLLKRSPSSSYLPHMWMIWGHLVL